jgi:hypothetical protein
MSATTDRLADDLARATAATKPCPLHAVIADRHGIRPDGNTPAARRASLIRQLRIRLDHAVIAGL